MNVSRIHIASILSILLVSGCTMSAVAPDDITLTAVKSERNVKLTLLNQSGDPIGYNLCTSGLQRRTAETWSGVETGDICTMEIRTLRSGESATFNKTLPDDIASGEYRYTTTVHWNENPVVVASNPFNAP